MPRPKIEPLTPEQIREIRRDPPRLMSVREAAAYIGVSHWKVREDIAAGRIPSLKLGGKILVRTSQLEKALAELET